MIDTANSVTPKARYCVGGLLTKILINSASWLMMIVVTNAASDHNLLEGILADPDCNITEQFTTINSPCNSVVVPGSTTPGLLNNGSLTNNSQISSPVGGASAFTATMNASAGFSDYTLTNNGTIASYLTTFKANAITIDGIGNFSIENKSYISAVNKKIKVDAIAIMIGPNDSGVNIPIFKNDGLIEAQTLSGYQNAIAIQINSAIDQFTNNGTISAQANPIPHPPDPFLSESSLSTPFVQWNKVIELLPPSNGGVSRITTLINSGTIKCLGSGNLDAGIYVHQDSTIGTITNTGFISSIANEGAITTINNQQGALGSGGSALSFTDTLPDYYNVIINKSVYGQVSAVDSISGHTNFGIYSGSNLLSGTYTSVLIEIDPNQINNFDNASFYNAGPGGYTYQWQLFQGPVNLDADAVDLHVLSSINPNYADVSQPYYQAGTVGYISNANATTMPLFEGGTLRLNQGNATYSFNFSLNGANTNTIDAAGLASTFSGSFSNTSNQTGTINIQDSVGGGSVVFSGNNTFTGPLDIGSGSFTLASSGSLIAAANISSGSNLNNLGLMNGAVNNASGGTVQNAGIIAGAISNSGALNNNDDGIISGALTNNANGTVTNESQITNSVFNNGVFTNGILGNITGNITNAQGGQFYNDSTISVGITNYGNFTNYENIQSTFINGGTGTVVNMGSMNDITNEVSGVIINYSLINNVTNNGTLYINGDKSQIMGGITGTGTVQINGNFTQEAPISNGAINVAGAFSQYPFIGGVAETTANSLSVGVAGYAAGSLNLLGNLTVGTAVIGGESGSVGVANIGGGTFASGNLIVGYHGNGTLNLIGGTLSVGNGTGILILASQPQSIGTLNIGTASDPGFGVLQASSIYGGNPNLVNFHGTAQVNFNYFGNYSFTPSIQGSVSVNQLGTGTLTLSGNNTYTGTTTATSGTLVSGNLSGSTLILQNGGAYSPGATNTIDTVSIGGLSLNGGDLLYNLGNATSDRINSSGTAALNGPVVFEFSNLGYSAGSFTLLTGNGVSTFNTANLSYNAAGNFSVTGNFVVSGNSLLFQTAAPAANYTWTGGAGNGNWMNSANWVTPPLAGATVHFAGANQTSVDTDTNQSVGGIVFHAGASAFTISNNTITLAGNVENDSTNTQTINSTLALGKNIHFAADSGNLAFGAPISLGENFLAVSGASSTAISGNISGTGGLLKRGPGNLTLSGTNTYTGNTSINGGNLIVQGGAALLDSGIVTLAASGATFTVGTSETIGSLLGGGTTAITANQTLTIAETGNATYAGAITGAGALTLDGSGTLTLSGTNTYSGNTTISGGALAVSGLLGGGNYSASITNNGSFLLASSSNQTLGGVISGTGALTKDGSGTLTLAGMNIYSGNTTINSGTLQVTSTGQISHSGSEIYVGGDGENSAVNINGGVISNYDGYIGYGNGSTGTVNMNTGTWTNGENLRVGYYGNGTLNLTGGNISNVNGVIGRNGTSNGAANVSGGTWSSSGFMTIGYNATGTLNLTGGNVVVGSGSGNITIARENGSNGTLNLGDGSTVGSLQAAQVIGGNGTAVVNFNHTGNYSFAPILADNLSVNKLGNGTTTLSANNTYTGTTTISAGALQIASTGVLGGGNYSGNITNNGALLLGSNSNQTLGGLISGTGALNKFGNGTVTLTGNNSYTGITTISAGTLRVAGGNSSGVDLFAGTSTGETGVFDMAGGSLLSVGNAVLGYLAGSTGVANITAGRWSGVDFTVGDGGNGTLNLTGGNLSADSQFSLGFAYGSNGAANISGGILSAGNLFVGASNGNGTLNLTAGNVSSDTSVIGGNTPHATGVANVSAGTWSSQNSLQVYGTLNLTGGNVSSGTGYISGGNGVANVSGGTWLNSSGLFVGYIEAGTLNLTGGVVSIGNGTGNLTLGAAGSVGTLNLGNGSSVGSLLAAGVVSGSGSGIVNFNNDADYAFAPILSGNLTMNKLGAGNLTLSGDSNYTGPTTISAGTLLVTGAIGSSPATIASGATLGGNGSLGGNLTLAAGSNLAFNLATSLAANGSSVSFGNFSLSNLAGFNGSSSSRGGFTVLAGTANVDTENLNNYGPANSETFGSNEVFFFTNPNGTNLKLTVAEAIQDLYWVGNNGTSWGSENWSTNSSATTGNASLNLGATLDLHFASTGANATNTANTTLSANTTVRHLTVSSGGNVGIGGTGVMLTLNSTAGPSLHLTGSASNVTISVPVIVAGGGIQIDEGNLELASISGSEVEIGTAAGTSFAFNTDSTLGFNGTIAGEGSFVKRGTGTVTLTGNNTYTGNTNIISGTLQMAGGTSSSDYFTAGLSAGQTGALDMAGGAWTGIIEGVLGYSAGSAGMANMTGGTWSMEEFVVGNSGNGTLNLSGGNLSVDMEFDIAGQASSTGVANVSGGTLEVGDFYVGLEGNGTLNLTGGAVTIGTGTMTLANSAGSFGTLNLGNGSSTGSLLALRVVGGSGTGMVNFNNNADDNFAPALAGNLSVNKLGTGTLSLSGNNTYTGATAISAGTLAFNSAYTQTLPGIVSGAGSILKSGTGTLALTGNNSFTGGTALAAGTLQALHAKALGNGALTLSSGTLALGNATTTNLALTGLTDLTWSSSNAVISLANGGNISASGNFTNGGNSGNRTFYFGGMQYLAPGNNTLVQFGGSTNFTASNFVASYTGNFSINGAFSISEGKLIYSFGGGNATGNVIDNSNPYDTPVWVDFTVNGNTGNGTVITLGGNNTIRDLTFANNGNLAIQSGYSLTLSQGQVAVENGTSVVSGGTLATPGNFNKTGAGELDVQSTLSVNGTASIDAGLLSVNGNLIANSVAVNSGATLGGSGTIFAPVTVSGSLSPGNSPGTLSMAALALTPTAVTDIEIESLTNFDRIVVGGAATVDGTLNVIPYNGNPLAYGQQYAFLTAGGGITGEFDTINAPATFRGRFLNQGTTGVLLIAPDTYTRVAVTPNQREVAQALDSFISATSGDRETVSIALDLQTAEQYPYAFEQIMPGFYESLANIAIEQTYNQAQLLSQRLGSVRLGATGFQAIGLSQPIKYDKDGKSASDAKTASPIMEAPANTNWNSWVIANGEFSISRGLSGVPNYNNNAGGFLVGADYRLSENLAAGLFAGYEYSYAKYNGGSSTQGNSALFGLYGSYTHEDGYYADAIVSGGYTGFQTRRSIEFSTIDRTARANPNSGQFSAALNLGKDFEIGKFTLGPIVGAQYTYAGIGGFTESGADSLDLALGQQNANSFRTNLGARLAYNWEICENTVLIPEVRGFWMHEFLNNPRNINSALAGGSGPSFDYETSAPYRNSIFGGVGISAKFADRWSASVFYNVNFGAAGYTNNIISTSVGFAF